MKNTSDRRESRPSAVEAPSRFGIRHHVPVVVGRLLQTLSVMLLVLAIPAVVLPDGLYWAASYLAVFGLSPEPFAFNAVLLFLLGAGLVRRLRAALIATVVFQALTAGSAVVDLVIDPALQLTPIDLFTADATAALIAFVVIAVLLAARREFTARLQPASYLLAAGVLVSGVSLAVVTGAVLSERFSGTLQSARDAWLWAMSAAIGVAPIDALLYDRAMRPAAPVPFVVSMISAVSLLVALLIMLRTARISRPMSAEDELAVRTLLAQTKTEDSLSYFATRRDKSVVFSPDGRAAVLFRVIGGVALASGDPIGHESSWSSAAGAFIAQSRTFGWAPAVLSVTERGARCYRRLGLLTSSMGEEAVLHTDERALDELRRNPQLRASARRVRRAGVTPRMRLQSELTPTELDDLVRLADEWRHDDVERGFSMALSRFGDPTDGRAIVVTAHDEDDSVTALLVFVPWNRDGLSLDLMRRSPDAVNGTTEFLIQWAVREAATRRIGRISLNFAMFRHILVGGELPGAGRLLRVQRRVLLLMSRRWQLDSLRRANERYSPEWRARFLCRDRNVGQGRVWWVAARAEGFLGTGSVIRRSRGRSLTGGGVTRPDDFAALVMQAEAQAAPPAPLVRRSRSFESRAERGVELEASGVDLHPPVVPRTHPLAVAQRMAAGQTDAGAGLSAQPLSVTGRVLRRRDHGGVLFLDLSEEHAGLQIVASADSTADYALLRRVQTGDIVSITGTLGTTRTGTSSLVASGWQLASKSLQELPGRAGLQDPETRIRNRHIDLATNASAAEMVRARSRAVRALRDGLHEDGYLEVETPILNAIHGGANARPFRTRINAYGMDLTLRIAPELALKRLIVAGFPQVFEIGRNFRNEGADATHNPEFTAVEAYRAHADYTEMRLLAQRLITSMAVAVTGGTVITGPDGTLVDLAGDWPVVSVCDAVSAALGCPIDMSTDADRLVELARARGVELTPGDDIGHLIEELYEELVEGHTTAPTFYVDFPASTSPLTRAHRSIPGLAERWDLVAFGTELGTAYTELADPVLQRERLTDQSLRAAGGDPEAMEVDEEFLRALEFGMPPTGGLGLGVDRVVMLLTGATIRESIVFPFVRPRSRSAQPDDE